jgi:hypothetical protein
MFLLRSAFWLTIVILLIPADPESGEAPRITVINALVAAQATIADLGGFCERNPDVCMTGSAAVDVFAEKAGNGVDMIYRYFGDAEDPDAGEGTLTTDDRALPWQGTIPDDSV